MKKIKIFNILIAIIIMLLSLSACDDGNASGGSYDNFGGSGQEYQITFVYNNGSFSSYYVDKGETISMPSTPQKKNYIFSGWYTDSFFNYRYDFSKEVTQNITLYAKYEIDAVTITNTISTDLIKGVLKVYNKSYKAFLGIELSSSTSQGSGFCFHIQDGCYYILTNCHVAQKHSGYKKQKYTIEDYLGNTYEGYLYHNPNKSVSAISPEYDLACLYFKPSSTSVKKLTIAYSNPSLRDDVIAVGAPKGQSNAITYGKAFDYGSITLMDTPTYESNVTFDVLWHNAATNNGSSGGPLLNANLEVVGVHYAGDRTGPNGYAIPAEKVQKFLRDYVYN